MNLLRGWRPEYFEQSTFLTDAVISGKPEIVAVLLFHGADPEQALVCPERHSPCVVSRMHSHSESSCAFEDAFTCELSEPFTRNG